VTGEPIDRAARKGHTGAPTHEAASVAADGVCDLCGWPVLDRHCKVLCLNCGYMRDCSDP